MARKSNTQPAKPVSVFKQYAALLKQESEHSALARQATDRGEDPTPHYLNAIAQKNAADVLEEQHLAPLKRELDKLHDAAYVFNRPGAMTKFKSLRSKLWTAQEKFKAERMVAMGLKKPRPRDRRADNDYA